MVAADADGLPQRRCASLLLLVEIKLMDIFQLSLFIIIYAYGAWSS